MLKLIYIYVYQYHDCYVSDLKIHRLSTNIFQYIHGLYPGIHEFSFDLVCEYVFIFKEI